MAFEMVEVGEYAGINPESWNSHGTRKQWTAREHLAAMAMQGVLADGAPNMNPEDVASYSFAIAYAMLDHAEAHPEVGEGS